VRDSVTQYYEEGAIPMMFSLCVYLSKTKLNLVSVKDLKMPLVKALFLNKITRIVAGSWIYNIF
jgi:hypothetical protein